VALITGGHHSIPRAIGSLIARIMTDPALRALVEQDPGRLPAAAEEVLRCVGMNLARAQMRIAAAELLAFAPDIELAEPVRWRGPAEPETLIVRRRA